MLFLQAKFHVVPRYDRDYIEVWCIQNDGVNAYNISYDSESGLLRKDLIEAYDRVDDGKRKPLLFLPRVMAENLFSAIVTYQSERGIKTKDENLIEGKLQATEVHLADMRDIVTKLMTAFVK